MESALPEFKTILDLETRHEDLLRRLDDLDSQVASTLAQWRSERQPTGEATPSDTA